MAITTAIKRMIDQHTIGMLSTLRADPDNAGTIYIGKEGEDIVYPLEADDRQVTRADLYTLFIKASVATQYLHIWTEEDVEQ